LTAPGYPGGLGHGNGFDIGGHSDCRRHDPEQFTGILTVRLFLAVLDVARWVALLYAVWHLIKYRSLIL